MRGDACECKTALKCTVSHPECMTLYRSGNVTHKRLAGNS